MEERKKERIDKGNIYCFWRAPLRYLGNEWRKVRRFFERGFYGYAMSDTWDFNSYLAKIISNGTKELAEDCYGYPGFITYSEWKDILNEISECFYRGMEENEFYKNEFEEDGTVPDDSEKRQKWFEEEMRLDEVREKDIQRGFELLSKWFGHLWD